MNVTTTKSANQLYKEQKRNGQTSLDFKSWLQQQKAKHFANVTGQSDIPVNTSLNDSVQTAIGQLHQEGGLQTQAGGVYTFGVLNTTWMWVGIGMGAMITGIIIYKIIHRK